MADATIWEITDGQFGLAVVDKAAPGYLDSWQAPGGKTVDTVTLADYDAGSATWTCQVTSGALTASQDTTTKDVPATFCVAGRTVPAPKQTSYTVDVSFLQDANVVSGLNRFLFEHDTEEAYVYVGFDDSNPPRLIGRCKLVAATIGGPARDTLTADVSLPLSRKPDVEFGDATASEIVTGGGDAPGPSAATGATAGTPGAFTPAGSTPPATGNPGMLTLVASPATAWTTGQYVEAGDGTDWYWDGEAWAEGVAP